MKYKGIILLVLGIIIGFVGNGFLTNRQNKPVNNKNLPEVATSTKTVSSSLHNKDDITSLINKFEEFNKQKNSANIIMLFTPPKTPEESDDFIHLNGLDLPSPMFRPYTTANWNFEQLFCLCSC